jgi:hypothetical protein
VEADLLFPWTTYEFVVRLNLLVPECFIGIHRYSFLPPRKVHSESQEQFISFFRYGNAMQEVLEIGLFLMMKTRYFKVGNVRRRLSVSDGK